MHETGSERHSIIRKAIGRKFSTCASVMLSLGLVAALFPASAVYAYTDTSASSSSSSSSSSEVVLYDEYGNVVEDPTAAEDPEEPADPANPDADEQGADTDEQGSAPEDGDADSQDVADEPEEQDQPDKKDKADKKDKETKKKERDAAKALARANSIANQLASLAVSLETATEELGVLNKKVELAKESLKKNRKELKETKVLLEVARENVAESACEMYKNGGTRILSVLLGATDFEDFASRWYLYEAITSGWESTFQKTEELSKEVESKTSKVQDKLAELKELQREAEEKGDEIALNLESQVALLSNLDKKLAKLVNKRTDRYLTRYADATSKANSASQAWFLGADTGSESKAGSHPQIVKIASQFLGVPYVWGGETPDGFDCSGLTMYCYAKLGIQLTHYARTQYDEGKHIKKSALMPGDLVFFGPNVEGIHHVGIYIGDDKFLHAPHTGDVVKVSKLSERSDCIGACRPQ